MAERDGAVSSDVEREPYEGSGVTERRTFCTSAGDESTIDVCVSKEG